MRITDEMDSLEYARFCGEKKRVDEKFDEALAWRREMEDKRIYEDGEKENNLLSAGFFSMNPVDFEKRLQ